MVKNTVTNNLPTKVTLLQAKEVMDPDAFTAMLRVALPFDETKACRLMQIAGNPLVRDNLDKMPNSYVVLHMVAKLNQVEFTAQLEDGTINPEATAKSISKGNVAQKHHSEGDYARGLPGKGASSNAQPQPSVAPAAGDSAEVALAKRIIAAAIALYECATDADKLDTEAIDAALEEHLETFSEDQKGGLLEGLRYAVQLADLVERMIGLSAAVA